MSASWLEDLLPQAVLSPRSRIWWILFFTLFPLAYVGGVMLEVAEESPARIAGSEDRPASIKTAEEFAASKGFAVAAWHQYAVARTDSKLLAYYGDEKKPGIAAASSLVPAREVSVLFRTADQSREFRVYLSLTGQVTGYEIGRTSRTGKVSSRIGILEINSNSTSDTTAGPAADNSAAEAIARSALSRNAALNSLVKLGTPDDSHDSNDSARTDFSWDAAPASLPGLTLKVKASVRDAQVVAERIQAEVDKAHTPAEAKSPIFLNIVYGCFLSFGAFYGIFRYFKRTLQKEVSHVRSLIVAALFWISYTVYAYSLGIDQLAVSVGGDTFSKVTIYAYISSAITFSIMGLLVGVAYGSGEGEVREAYPGKLTSLDALLAGKIFSSDVAASLLFGMAAAGWLLLCQHALSYFFHTDIAGARTDVLSYTFARLPWLTLLLGKQYDSLLIAVAGLLLPAAFLLRRSARKRRRFAWLIVFALLSVFHDAAHYSTVAFELLAMVVFVAALLLPFFAFDLLAAMVSFSALSYADELSRLAAVVPSWIGLAVSLAALAAAMLMAAAYLSLRGHRVREEDVRPLYAKNLAERMSLQAEVLAAREAQLRLLPQVSPELPGIQVAAVCLPAHGVGGDFYDFFFLDASRTGIFVAQGGRQGLASALCIALAKGILMHTSRQPLSPTQIIVDLEASIAELLEGTSGGGISFAYGVMDTRRNLLSYARIGSSPRLMVYCAGAGLTPAAQLERVVTVAHRSKHERQIFEGSAHTQTGDTIIFFTEGVTSLRTRRFGNREFQWLDILMRELERPEEALQISLFSALEKYQKNATNDLTAVVLRVVESQALRQEGVA